LIDKSKSVVANPVAKSEPNASPTITPPSKKTKGKKQASKPIVKAPDPEPVVAEPPAETTIGERWAKFFKMIFGGEQ